MDNKYYPYDQGDQTNQSNQPTYAPMPEEATMPPPPPPKKSKLILILIIAGIALVLVIGLVILAAATSKKPQPKQTQIQEDPNAKEKISSDNIYIGDKQVNFNFEAPKKWRSQPVTNLKVVYPWENATPIVGFGFLASPLGQIVGITADNEMILRDITEWLDLNQSTSNKLFTISNKKSQIELLKTFKNDKSLTADEIKNVINFQTSTGNLEIGGRQKPLGIASNDGRLNGVIYMTILGPNYYEPHILVMMSGKVNDKTVYLYSDFVVYDQLYKKLGTKEAANNKNWAADTKKAIEDFRAGSIAEDASKIYDEAREVIQTIKIEDVAVK
ncbi:MAG: hypothetical protein Q8P54_02915 [bacterium]|nr:hypothetical protein [bacterium]